MTQVSVKELSEEELRKRAAIIKAKIEKNNFDAFLIKAEQEALVSIIEQWQALKGIK